MARQTPASAPAAPKLDAKQGARMCRDVVKHMEERRDEYTGETSAKEYAWALQNARVVQQCYELNADETPRDLSMARNVRWILEQAPRDTKIVLWAHNGHVMTHKPILGSGSMGATLREWYGDKLVVLGFAANTGRYTAMTRDKGLSSDNELQAAAPGAAEYWFHRAGVPRFVLDLRKVSAEEAGSAWLTKPVNFRSIGALAMEQQFFPWPLTKAFDGLIYIDKTTAARTLKQ